MPSDNLMMLLTELQLCDQRDIAACEADVRRLCHDLPDFDSVWLDALAQRNVITPWQADVLQSAEPRRLQVDRFLLREPLGEVTFLAETDSGRRQVVLRRMRPIDINSSLQGRLATLVEQLDEVRQTVPTSLDLPRQLVTERDEQFLASSYVPGYPTDELLVRGGRLPWQVVAEIGMQLLTAMRWLESKQMPHGHISLKNVRLRADGRTVLVAPFVHRLQRPHVSFSPDLRLQDVETIAPEIVSTGAMTDSQSEIYSLGCVMWQLLTSRPTFLSADPVNRILKAKETDVSDVRTLVPDCPDWMARLIQSFTRRTPQLRPASVEQAYERWAEFAPKGVAATKRLLKRMPDRTRRKQSTRLGTRSGNKLWPAVTAVTMIAGFALYGVQRGLLPMPLQLGVSAETTAATHTYTQSPQRDETGSVDANSAAPERTTSGLLKMPAPDAGGVVVLDSAGVYEAADLSFQGVMYIEATSDQSAVVIVPAGRQWAIRASQIAISNVQIQNSPDSESDRSQLPLVDCVCDVLALRRCVMTSSRLTSCIRWHAMSGVTGVVKIENTILSGAGYGLWMSDAADRCELRNTLVTTAGSAIRYDTTTSGTLPKIQVSRVTQVNGKAFLDLIMNSASSESLRMEIECGESVLVPETALVRLAGPKEWQPNRVQVAFLLPERGNPTIVPPGVDPVVHFDRSLNQLVGLSESQVISESLLLATAQFRKFNAAISGDGNTSIELADYELLDYEGPKLSPRLPGVDISLLPAVIDKNSTDDTEPIPTARR